MSEKDLINEELINDIVYFGTRKRFEKLFSDYSYSIEVLRKKIQEDYESYFRTLKILNRYKFFKFLSDFLDSCPENKIPFLKDGKKEILLNEIKKNPEYFMLLFTWSIMKLYSKNIIKAKKLQLDKNVETQE
ncbi:MAG: hypothetical protein NZZ41_06785 [Candidatus Dojkabacteria bacterium]|nr:hypothetical protein [Candidatus Dojkabacteria bacterium]